MPQPNSEIGFYPQQYSKVLLPVGYRNHHVEKVVPNGMSSVYNSQLVYDGNMQQRISDHNIHFNNQETLDLFPLHPTGILEGKTTRTDKVSSLVSVSADSSTDTTSGSPDINEEDGCPENQPFFDFFNSRQGS